MFDENKVREALARLRKSDEDLSKELQRILDKPEAEVANNEIFQPRDVNTPTFETIVLRTGRPVLAIASDNVQLVFQDSDSEVWKQRLAEAQSRLTNPIRAVGRIELEGHPIFTWVGTGWLVRPDIIATNRHVAREFGRRAITGFRFRTGIGQRPITASIDFFEELNREEERVAKIQEILHIEDDDGPDLAFLRVTGMEMAKPITLATEQTTQFQQVAVIGYPARDSRIPDQDLMEQLFGNVYDKKRCAPGQIQQAGSNELQHDCSTLGGNSGAPVLDLATGNAVGIHFAGRFLQANYAVPATVIEERLQAIERGETRRPAAQSKPTGTSDRDTTTQAQSVAGTTTKLECVIPIKVTIEVGATIANTAGNTVTPRPILTGATSSVPSPSPINGSDDDEIFIEGVASDYLDRKGYLDDFLGSGQKIPLPKITRGKDQIVEFNFDENPNETVLRYLHFSVVMHRKRRVCFYSAVNIDGNQYRKTKRPAWMIDPRIPKELQIMKECYGNPPKFSRGHMTRREDPAWGSASVAQRGNADSMHVTNAVPQMQTFNGGIWLGLEDYALQNAREDDMKICVITGPVFHANDPVMYGVKIPQVFWKVIAFIHDETGQLSATGYSISQEKFLQPEEFVFGAYETHQRSLRWIETQAGVSFGSLTEKDLFEDEEEALSKPLLDFRQIKFV